MVGTESIPEYRSLTQHEEVLVRWMLQHGSPSAAEFLPQLAEARVVSRCYCGCASVNFSVAGVVPQGVEIGIVADFEYRSAAGHLFGAFVFERARLLAGLEVWSVDGQSTPSELPQVAQLQPLQSDNGNETALHQFPT